MLYLINLLQNEETIKYNEKVCFTCEKSNTYSYKTYGRTFLGGYIHESNK